MLRDLREKGDFAENVPRCQRAPVDELECINAKCCDALWRAAICSLATCCGHNLELPSGSKTNVKAS